MGDINFNIAKDVDLNKRVTLDIDKDVNVNVNNPDQLATAESDAEAFGPNALAEVDTYTLVTAEGGPTEINRVIGLVDALGNSVTYVGGGPIIPSPIPGAGVYTSVFVDFTSDGTPPPDVDDINGFGKLDFLSSPPPDTPDVPIPDPLFSITDANFDFVEFQSDAGDAPLVEAVYELRDLLEISFGSRTADLNGDGTPGTGELKLIVPSGTYFTFEYVGLGEAPPETPPDGPIEFQFETLRDTDGDGLTNAAYFMFDADPNDLETFDGNAANQLPNEPFFPGLEVPSGTYLANSFELSAESLQDPGIADIGDWAFEAEGIFYQRSGTSDGTAFSYAESTSALDVNPTVLPSQVKNE